MKASGARRYAVCGGAVSVIVGLALFLVARPFGESVVRWSLLGWLAMTAIGIGGGAWLVAAHGTRGWNFIAALSACMLARLVALAAGAIGAAVQGQEVVWPNLIGLGAGYLPLQLFEVGWFLKSTKNRP